MPTTPQEAERMVEIVLRHIPPEKAFRIFHDLDTEVGSVTENASVKETLSMLKGAVVPAHTAWNMSALDRVDIPPDPTKSEQSVPPATIPTPVIQADCHRVYQTLLIGLVIIHYVLVLTNVFGVFVVPIYLLYTQPFLIAVMTSCLIIAPNVWMWGSRVVDCPLTTLENHLRKRLGYPQIRGWIGHYIIYPIRLLRKHLAKQRAQSRTTHPGS